MSKERTLHIYGQAFQHEPVEIGGSHSALRDLADAIYRALANGDCQSDVFYVNDGEGYLVHITVVPEERLSQLRVPYSDSNCCEFANSPQKYPSQTRAEAE